MARTPLSGNLRRLADVCAHLDAPDEVRLVARGEELVCGREVLLILDVFRSPIPARIAVTQLKDLARCARLPWEQMEATLIRLVAFGILCDDSGKGLAATGQDGIEAAPYHVAMLNDRTRTSRFLEALGRAVRPGDVVVDIGTGTGILALAAARAGAGRVYAVERGPIAALAESLCAGQERITLIRGSSHDIELPERADVLVSELLGDEPLGEGMLASIADALERHLKPGGRCVPSRLQVLGLPLSIPEDRMGLFTLTRDTVSRWREWYGLDYSAMLTLVGAANFSVHVYPQSLRDLEPLAEPLVLLDLDLQKPAEATFETVQPRTALRSGVANGLLVTMEVELFPGIRLSTHPRQAAPDNHWRTPLWLHRESFAVEAGEPFEIHAAYRPEWGRIRVGLHRCGGVP